MVISFLTLFYGFIVSVLNALDIRFMQGYFNGFSFSFSLLDVILGVIIVTMVISLFWRGAKG